MGHWFLTHPTFQFYVKHIEFWFPLFEKSPESRPRVLLRTPSTSPIQETHTPTRPYYSESYTATTRIPRAMDNATLEEVLGCAKVLFPEACVLTLEGSHRKNSPKVQHFRSAGSELKTPSTSIEPPEVTELSGCRHLPEQISTKTLVLKGSWNIIRCAADFQNLAVALPSVREWHCNYAKPKTDAYKAMCGVLRSFPRTITKINICLEGLNCKQPSPLSKWRKLFPQYHICKDLGRTCPQLEDLSYTGHVCHCLFKSAIAGAATVRGSPRLKSIDLCVRNVCRDSHDIDDGPSIHNWPFIQAFENLVVEAIASLSIYRELSYVRIRFLDLDSPRPVLNPYWHLQNNEATGVWSSRIVDALKKARPSTTPYTLDDGEFKRAGAAGPSNARPKSLHIMSYASLARML